MNPKPYTAELLKHGRCQESGLTLPEKASEGLLCLRVGFFRVLCFLFRLFRVLGL